MSLTHPLTVGQPPDGIHYEMVLRNQILIFPFIAITYLLTCIYHSALGLDGTGRSNQIINIIVAIVNACIDEHHAEYTPQALIARGWIVPAGNAWQRVVDLEDSLQVLQEVVQTNHEQVTGQLQDINTQLQQVLQLLAQVQVQVQAQAPAPAV